MHVFQGYLMLRIHPLCIQLSTTAALHVDCWHSPFSPTICRYRTCGWLVKRLQGYIGSNSRSGWRALPNDSLNIEALIDWAEKVLVDMGHKSQAHVGEVRLHHSLPPSSTIVVRMLPGFHSWIQMHSLLRPPDGWTDIFAVQMYCQGRTLTWQLSCMCQLCSCKTETRFPADA